jgi:hypothetical protein
MIRQGAGAAGVRVPVTGGARASRALLRRSRDDSAGGQRLRLLSALKLVAWIIGWDLILEYAVGNAAGHLRATINTLLRNLTWRCPCG